MNDNDVTPYPIGYRVIFHGNNVIITGCHPHGDSWRYSYHRADLAGSEGYFTHEEATEAENPPRTTPTEPVIAGDPVRSDMERARLEQESTRRISARAIGALEDLLDVVRDVDSRYEIPELHQALGAYAGAS